MFSPSDEEVAWSRKIIAAFKEPQNARKGVITVEGRMVERLHLVMAERMVGIAEAVAGAAPHDAGKPHRALFRGFPARRDDPPCDAPHPAVGRCFAPYRADGIALAVTSSADFARAVGYRTQPLDDLLVFNMVFGKTVPDISLNAVANLGYADCRFLRPVAVGDTPTSVSEVIGLKENSNRQTGVVHVRSTA